MPARGDALQASLRPKVRLNPEKLREWSRPAWSWALVHLFGELLGMLSAVALAVHWPNPASWLFAMVWVGARQHALLVFMHEATHGRLVPSRWWNDRIGEVVLAWPFFISMHAYRKEHWAHHRHVNTERDPDWARTHAANARDWHTPLTPRHLFTLLGRDVSVQANGGIDSERWCVTQGYRGVIREITT